MLKNPFKRNKTAAPSPTSAFGPGGTAQTTSLPVPPAAPTEEPAAPVAAVAAPRVAVSDAVWVERRRFPRELPVADVIEGTGGDTDWNLWDGANKPSTKH
jgi:hypothetical protein